MQLTAVLTPLAVRLSAGATVQQLFVMQIVLLGQVSGRLIVGRQIAALVRAVRRGRQENGRIGCARVAHHCTCEMGVRWRQVVLVRADVVCLVVQLMLNGLLRDQLVVLQLLLLGVRLQVLVLLVLQVRRQMMNCGVMQLMLMHIQVVTVVRHHVHACWWTVCGEDGKSGKRKKKIKNKIRSLKIVAKLWPSQRVDHRAS